MKEILIQGMTYAHAVDELVFKLTKGISSEERKKNRGSHFGSIDGILSHIYDASIFLLGHLEAATPSISILKGWPDSSDLPTEEKIGLLPKLDQRVLEFLNGCSEDLLEQKVEILGQSMNVGGFFVNLFFRHSVHHRGQISQILDEMKIEHDMLLLKG